MRTLAASLPWPPVGGAGSGALTPTARPHPHGLSPPRGPPDCTILGLGSQHRIRRTRSVCNTQRCGFWQIGLAQNRGGRKVALLCLLVHPSPFCAPTMWGRDYRRSGCHEDSGEPRRPGASGEGVEETLEGAMLS